MLKALKDFFDTSPTWALFVACSVVVTLIGGVAGLVHWAIARRRRPSLSAEPQASITVTGAPEKRWMDCRYCDGRGWFVSSGQYNNFGGSTETRTTCARCGGRGRIFTELWKQPDCRHCGGTAKVITKHTSNLYGGGHTEFGECHVCWATGKELLTNG